MEAHDPTASLGPLADPEVVGRLLGDGMVLFSAVADDGTIVWMGESTERILGRPARELIGTNALELVHPDDQEVLALTFSEDARGSRDRILAVLRLAHADGSWTTFEFGGVDLRGPDGSGVFLSWGRSYTSTSRLLDVLGSLLSARDLEQILDEVLGWCDAQAPDTVSAALCRAPDGAYRAAAWGALPSVLGLDLRIDADTPGPWAQSIATGSMAEAPCTELSPELAAAAADSGLHAVWSTPVPDVGDGPPAALLVCWRRRPGPILATHRRHLDETARLAQLALRWAESHHELLTRATTDPLTGMGNRADLEDRVGADRPTLAALLFCDLDDFKAVNDRHGHLVGDRILREVATRMADACAERGRVARLGGDEFAIWCPSLAHPKEAEAIADDVLSGLEPPFGIDGAEHHVRCSIGMTVVAGDDPDAGDLEALLRAADAALYRAKRTGGAGWASRDDS
ncbi:GGDEF domain-containing protein [Iamia sp.]|uniref:GGDEF domain-containing protein n=1 Tax=Iamia sp. TaxID=2722710 RepID=UPI002BF4C7FD|nr:GGDEF domain-containing protein [Iamia sp.]HXH56233.1 GGDEF domain-containing protein [Iamia sp.]